MSADAEWGGERVREVTEPVPEPPRPPAPPRRRRQPRAPARDRGPEHAALTAEQRARLVRIWDVLEAARVAR